jgi:peptidoglycan/xylan/chitin deacetylase (PgdA/CDA1 family)
MKMARIGLLFESSAAKRRWDAGTDCFGRFVGEVLSHAGIPYTWIDDNKELRRSETDVVLVLLTAESKESAAGLLAFAEQGGTVIAYGGVRSLAAMLGCAVRRPLGVGYAAVPAVEAGGCAASAVAPAGVPMARGAANDDAAVAEDNSETSPTASAISYARAVPLRFFAAEPWATGGATVPHEACGELRQLMPDGEPAGALLDRFRVGAGRIDRFAVPIGETIVHMQQGTGPVVEDGIPAPDGTGQVNDGILKADDRCPFDWEYDRRETETGAKYFAWPQADLWREVLIGHLLKAAGAMGLTVPFLDYWPDGTEHVAMISHDSDHNQDEQALAALDILQETGVRSTWCMLEPGYSPPIYDKVKAAGHELAFHYNALEPQGGRWGGDEFRRQLEWLRSAAGIEQVTSNKNHYTRFEGWGELFAWCEQNGIAVDQTRGSSKPGNVGFLFGTCHPFRPISRFDERNRLYNAWELIFLTQDMDLGVWADSSIMAPFLEEVAKVGGVAHFLFHQTHLHSKPMVRDAFRKVVREARERGFEFWTCAEIYAWHAARRETVLAGLDEVGDVLVENAPDKAVVWIPVEGERRGMGVGRDGLVAGGVGPVSGGQSTGDCAGDPACDSELAKKFGVLCRRQVVAQPKTNVASGGERR